MNPSNYEQLDAEAGFYTNLDIEAAVATEQKKSGGGFAEFAKGIISSELGVAKAFVGVAADIAKAP